MFSFRNFIELLNENEGRLNFIKKQHPHIPWEHDHDMADHVKTELNREDGIPLHYRQSKMVTLTARHQESLGKEVFGQGYPMNEIETAKFQKRISGHIVNLIAKEVDPTDKKIYTDWLVRQYKARDAQGNPHFRWEDRRLIKEELTHFHNLKQHLPKKDINQYKHPAELQQAYAPFLGKLSNTQDLKRIKKEGVDVLYDKNGLRVERLKTQEAACALHGHDTRWCTSARENNAFDYYHQKGDLFVIHTPDKQKYQLHFQSGQLMDAGDRGVDPHGFTQKYPELKKVPELARKSSVSAMGMGLRGDLDLAFMNDKEKKKELDHWVDTVGLENLTHSRKEMIIQHGDERQHEALSKKPTDGAPDSLERDQRQRLIAKTKSQAALKNLAGRTDYFPYAEHRALHRLETEFGYSPKDSLELHDNVRRFGYSSPEHLRHVLVAYSDHERNESFPKPWHEAQKSKLEQEYKKHFPRISKRHDIKTVEGRNAALTFELHDSHRPDWTP